MEHRRLDEISQIADIVRSIGVAVPMSRQERLEHWISLLEERGDQPMRALTRIEFMRGDERMHARADGSPLALAYGDPALRAAGLSSDEYGAALRFFDLTDGQAHYVLCDCHYQGNMTARLVAARVRSVGGLNDEDTTRARTIIGRFWDFVIGR
jgi:hypothetical protein